MSARRYGSLRPWIAMAEEVLTGCKARLGMLWSQRGIQAETDVRIASTVRVRGTGQVLVRSGARIGPHALLAVEEDGVIEIGPGVQVGRGTRLNARRGQSLVLGAETVVEDDVQIVSVAGVETGPGAVIGARTAIVCREPDGSGAFKLGARAHLSLDNLVDICADVSVGDEVRTGPGCVFYTHKHTPSRNGLIWDQPVVTAPIHIGDGVWIGHACQVMPGVEIGDGAVIGAGAVVTKPIAAATVVAGVPARQLTVIGG